MLRVRFLQHWYALSDPFMEEALYGMAVLRPFAEGCQKFCVQGLT